MAASRSEKQITRRDLARGAAAGGAFFAAGMALGGEERTIMTETVFDVRKFGATGDGKTDDSAAIQKALDAAGETRAAAFVPPGTYLCADLKVHKNTALVGIPAWGYGRPAGGSVLKLAHDKAKCVLDMAGAVGATVEGLAIDGQKLGKDICGISIVKDDYATEDALRIERCQVARFSGDALRMSKIWCFTVRHCMFAFSANGINCEGWDGFVLDCWMSGNNGFGYGPGDVCSVTMTSNRIEWNKEGGIVLIDGSHYNVTGNYIDRSGKAGIAILAGAALGGSKCMTVTGNLIYRSGKSADPDSHDSSHVRIQNAAGIVFTGNAMTVGQDDAQKGTFSPSFGVVYGNLTNTVIKDNVLHNGALKQLMVDLGGHGEGVIVSDNPGCLRKTE